MFIDNIRKIMKDKKIRPAELAEISGVPYHTLVKILQGYTTNPRLDTIQAIAEALDCSLDEFTDWEKEPPNEIEEYLDALHKRPEMKALFSISKKATKEDIEKTIKIIEMFKGTDDEWIP